VPERNSVSEAPKTDQEIPDPAVEIAEPKVYIIAG